MDQKENKEQEARVLTTMQADKRSTPPAHSQANQKPSRAPIITVFVVLGILLSAGAGYVGALMATGIGSGQTSGVTQFEQIKGDGNTVVTESEKDVSSVIAKVSPGVVSIITSSDTPSRGYSSGYSYQAAGTGMIVSKDGFVMTNKHVINGATRATVVMSSGKSYKNVPVLGSDPLNDIAFLKIPNVKDLTPLELGDSKTVRAGQSVIAIGNALGQYQNTVTTGIISGLGRPVVASSGSYESAESLTDLIQTDAAINQGNSGGPLLNAKGQVIGINTAIAQDAQGIGFAIPVGATKGMLNHLIASGKVQRAIVGVQYVSVTPEVREEYKLTVDKGDLITAISGSDTPAAKAGLKKDDVIVKVNNHEIGPGKSVSTLVGEFKPGDTVQLTVLRDGREVAKNLTLTVYEQ